MHDSGKRQQFEGGAVRDTAEGKPQYSLLSPYVWKLIPLQRVIPDIEPSHRLDVMRRVCRRMCDYLLEHRPEFLESAFEELSMSFGIDRLCEWLRLGAEKYDRFNWAKGMPISRCIDSLGRHLSKWDKDDEDHIAAVMCNIMFIIHYHQACEAGLLPKKWMDLWDFNQNKEAV